MLDLICNVSNLFITTESFEKKINSLLKNKREGVPKSKSSFFYGAYFSLKSISSLYDKLNTLPSYLKKDAIKDLNLTLSEDIISNYLTDFEKNLGRSINKKEVNLDNIEEFFDSLSKDYKINDSDVDYESFITGVQTIISILKYSYYNPINEKYKGFTAKFVTPQLDKIIDKLRFFKK